MKIYIALALTLLGLGIAPARAQITGPGCSPNTPCSVQGVPSGTPIPVTPTAGATSTVIAADVVTLSGGAAITMFATGHCANGCRISVPVAFCTNPLTTATGTATTGGNECWQANQSVAMPPTGHAISVFSTTASTASGIGSTVP